MPDKPGQLFGRFLQGAMQGYLTGTQMGRQRKQDEEQRAAREQQLGMQQQQIDLQARGQADTQAFRTSQAAEEQKRYKEEQDRLLFKDMQDISRYDQGLAFKKEELKDRRAGQGKGGPGGLKISDLNSMTKLLTPLVGEQYATEMAPNAMLALQMGMDPVAYAQAGFGRMRGQAITQKIINNPEIGVAVSSLTYPNNDMDTESPWINGEQVAEILAKQYKIIPAKTVKYTEQPRWTPSAVIDKMLIDGLDEPMITDVFELLTANQRGGAGRLIQQLFGDLVVEPTKGAIETSAPAFPHIQGGRR